jgi:hypothetical protein
MGGGDAAPAGGRGTGMFSGINNVHADKLWRDRISVELQQQRTWHDEYGFMSTAQGSGSCGESDQGSGTYTSSHGASGGNLTSLPPNITTMTMEELDHIKSEVATAALRSTAQASFGQRSTLELRETKAYNRKKHF